MQEPATKNVRRDNKEEVKSQQNVEKAMANIRKTEPKEAAAPIALEVIDESEEMTPNSQSTQKVGKKRGRKMIELQKYFEESQKKIDDLQKKLDFGKLSAKEKKKIRNQISAQQSR